MDQNYKGNSNRSKEEQALPKRTEPVVGGAVHRREKTGLSKVAGIFLPGDVDSVKSYILSDVLVPTIKRAILDVICNGASMLMGEKPKNSAGPGAKVSYRQYYRDDQRDYAKPRTQQQHSYDDIIFENRGDAEAVLERMEELVDRFGTVSVADLFDLAGMSCQYTDNKYGWTNLNGVQVIRVRDGYQIDLPRASSL